MTVLRSTAEPSSAEMSQSIISKTVLLVHDHLKQFLRSQVNIYIVQQMLLHMFIKLFRRAPRELKFN